MKVEYFILNADDVVCIVYKHETFGRVMVITPPVSLNHEIRVIGYDGNTLGDGDLKEFLISLLPKDKS